MALLACGGIESHPQAAEESTALRRVSELVKEYMADGSVIKNPYDDSGRSPYLFTSVERRADFEQQAAQLGVKVKLPTVAEYAIQPLSELPLAESSQAKEKEGVQAQYQQSCGDYSNYKCVYDTVGYCKGTLEWDPAYVNPYLAVTQITNWSPGSMEPFTAEVALPDYSTSLKTINANPDVTYSGSFYIWDEDASAKRAKHRCCYWFKQYGYMGPYWTSSCSNYFYTQL
jgi:hypothetical protein